LKQIGLAFHEYELHIGKYPLGVAQSKDDGDPTGVAGFGWGTALLPHLQQKALHTRLDLPKGHLDALLKDAAKRELAQVPLPNFRCPSDTGYELNDNRPFTGAKYGDLIAAKANYIGNHGTRFMTLAEKQSNYRADSFGMLWPGTVCNEASVIDGTSNTILVGERRSEDWAGVWIGVRNPNSHGDSGLPQVFGISDVKINDVGERARRGFSSNHPDGSLFVFADGHVEFIEEGIDFNQAGATSQNDAEMEQMGLYQRLIRRNDRQVIKRR
jgi:prepilin-type processing-associated H-X9-DG protein